MKTPIVIAVIGITLLVALRIWHTEGAMSPASDSLCVTFAGPPFIIADESRATIAVRLTDVAFFSLDTGHADGARIPMSLPLLAASMPQAASTLLLALSDAAGVRISSFDLKTRRENSTEFFDDIDARLAVFAPSGKYLFGVTTKGKIFKVDLFARKVETFDGAATKANSLAVSKNGERLYVAGMGLTIVDTTSMRIESELTTEPNLIEVSASPDGHTLALRNWKSIELYDLINARGSALASVVVDTLPNVASVSSVSRLAFAPDGSVLFYIKASGAGPELLALSTKNLHVETRIPTAPYPNALAFVPDRGWILVTAGYPGQEKLVAVDINAHKVVFESALSGASSAGPIGSGDCSMDHKEK